MPQAGTPISAFYFGTTNPATIGLGVAPGDFWWDNTTLRVRTNLNVWRDITTVAGTA